MISVSKRKVFIARELELWRRAQILVATVDLSLPVLEGKELRCHELARVVGLILDLGVVDGMYGCMEHSWLVIEPQAIHARMKILDVYAPGQAPQVQLLDSFVPLGHPALYKPGARRTDIHKTIIEAVKVDVRQRIPVW